MNLNNIQTRLSALSEADRAVVVGQIEKLIAEVAYDLNSMELNHEESIVHVCPYCQSRFIKKNGVVNEVQRYVCKECRKNFRTNTGRATAYLKKKDKFKVYISHFIAGHSIRKCAQLTGVCIQTSFDWRHKILSAFDRQQQDTTLSGICESDDIFITFSEKGERNLTRKARKRGKGIFEPKSRGISKEKVAVIVSSDRKGQMHLQVAKRGRISTKDIKKVLDGKLEEGSVLCTDAHRSYTAFAKSEGIEHHTIKASAKEYKKGIYHVQHVNNIASSLKKWLDGFNGVSTKYLQNYLNWYAVLSTIEKSAVPPKTAATLLTLSTTAWALFNEIKLSEYLL
jgi:transposase-like protein